MKTTLSHILLVLYIIIQHATVSALYCYKCSSTDEKNCKIKQSRQECKYFEEVCISIKFSYKTSTTNASEINYGFRKKCAVGKLGCQYPCRAAKTLMGYQSCSVLSCCKSSMCNRDTQTYLLNRRRRGRKNGTNRNTDSLFPLLTVLVVTISAIHY